MMSLTQELRTFPSVRLPAPDGGLPVEVSLIAQLDPGAGDALIASTAARQRRHQNYIDALDEPSARIGDTDFERGDASSLYTFLVDRRGHPFHRHRGHRVFTAITGSGGTQLRFAMLDDAAWQADPSAFLRAMRCVDLPPDCLFTVRFGGGTWHQFVPKPGTVGHPALFALSCHTNELGGALPEAVKAQVLANAADIPSLTEVLPEAVTNLLNDPGFDLMRVPTTALALGHSSEHRQGRLCAAVRRNIGPVRAWIARLRGSRAWVASNGGGRVVLAHADMPSNSLLNTQFAGASVHADAFELRLAPQESNHPDAASLLADVLNGFLEHRPIGVTRLMQLRNALVRPFGLRTSQLGCPVSSLLGSASCGVFAGLPVHQSQVADDGSLAEVVLGADDKHLAFRSVVRVERRADGGMSIWLGTRVKTRNLFGVLYMNLIERVHRHYVSPTMLRLAAAHAVDAPLTQAPAKPAQPAWI